MEQIQPKEELDERLIEAYKEIYRLRRLNNSLRAEATNRKYNEVSALSEAIRLRRMVELYAEENTDLKKKLAERDKSIKGYRRWHAVYRKEIERMEGE